MNPNLGGVLKDVRTRAGNAGLGCEFEDDLKTPYASVSGDGKYTKIVVPMPDPLWEQKQWDLWWYMLEHELGHIVPAMLDSYDVLKEKKIGIESFLGYGMNLLEDHRQEWHERDRYLGRKQRLNKGRRIFLDGQDFASNGQSAADEHRLAGEVLYAWDTHNRESWQPAVIGKGDEIASYFTPKQVEWLDKLRAGDYEDTLKSNITAWEEYDLLQRIITEVFEFDFEQEEQDAQQAQEQSTAGEGEESADEDGDGNAKGKKGDAGDEEGEADGRCGGTVDYSDLLAHQHDEVDKDNTLGWSGLHINYDARSGRFRPVDPKEIKILDYTDGSQSIAPEPRYLQEITRVASQGSGLAKHVRRLLQARSAAKYQHGLKRGKISPKSMFRGGMTGTGEYQQKIYRKKQVINLKDTAVQVVVDCSGSMDGDKYVHASASAVLLNEAISTIGVPVEIFGFDDCYRSPQHAIWKTFDKSVTLDELIGRVSTSVNQMMNSNSDGESIMWGYERLMKRRERRKIMIVLSDGSPACSRGDADYYTDQIIKTIEQGGVAEIYGIGIMDRNVTRLYKDHAVIRSAGELESALLNVVQTKILN